MVSQKIEGIVQEIRTLNNNFNIVFLTSDTIDSKYKTKFNNYVAQGYGHLSENEKIILCGSWEYSSKYKNWVFKFDLIERKKPVTKNELIAYLQSSIFTGIGPNLASRIVDKLGMDCLDVINSSPEKLLEVEGIGMKKYKTLMENYNNNEVLNMLTKLLVVPPINLSSNIISKIYKEFGNSVIGKLEENPYILAEKIVGLNFQTADLIATTKFDIKLDSYHRLRSGVMYCLKTAILSKSHTFLPIAELFDEFKKLFPDIPMSSFMSTIKSMNGNDIIVLADKNDIAKSAVFPKSYYKMEVLISHKIKELISEVTPISNIFQAIKDVEDSLGIKYAKKQKDSIEMLNKSGFFIITGGPGTGKSTVINGLYRILKKNNKHIKIAMAAPTGRASKRLEESTGHRATTIHKLLEYKPIEGFFKNEENPLDIDVLIIDESSMIDTYLMYFLTKAIRKNTKVILLGDVHQLPSVGAGCVLRDLINSEAIPVVKLDQVFRQGENSLININAQKISNGDTNLFYKKGEFELIENSYGENLVQSIVDRFINDLFSLKEIYGSIEKALYNIQILTPTNVGKVGTTNINRLIQSLINKNSSFINIKDSSTDESESLKFIVGDKVMQTSNNTDKDVYNGDIGIISSIDVSENESIIKVIYQDGKIITYSKEEAVSNLVLAYAITIHKSQGSESNVIIMVTTSAHNKTMNQRNLIYTGITRAKKKVSICGDINAINHSILTMKAINRYTMLKEFIQIATKKD